jgi:hypothetical protein
MISIFSTWDLFCFPLTVILLYFITKRVEKKEIKLLLTTFWIHVLLVFIHALVIQYYFGGGDAVRYYVCMLNMRQALQDNIFTVNELFLVDRLDPDSVLAHYFRYDVIGGEVFGGENYFYMQAVMNFTVVRLATLVSMVVQPSFLAVSMVFSYFALMGSWLVYKKLSEFYPVLKKEIAVGMLFIPTVLFWSSSLLKDPVTFGALGFILFGIYNLLAGKRIVFSLLFCIIIPAYLTFLLKAYILLCFAPAIILLVLLTKSKQVQNVALRNLVYIVMIGVSAGLGFLLYQNLTSTEMAQQFQTDVIMQKFEEQRNIYGRTEFQAGSSFSLGTTNPLLIFPMGIVTALFRPYLWEVRNPLMLLSALESLLFVLLTLYIFFKVGFFTAFKYIFTHPLTLFCFVFSILFAGAVGASTGNFGSLVRYKIPGMPFYFLMLILLYYQTSTAYPRWFVALLKKIRV